MVICKQLIEKVFHLHRRCFGDNVEFGFRDYFVKNISVAKQYETLKLDIRKKFEYNRDCYTNAKI